MDERPTLPGKYLLHDNAHFQGFRIFEDGCARLQMSHRAHECRDVDLEVFDFRRYKIWKIVQTDLGECWPSLVSMRRTDDDECGGADVGAQAAMTLLTPWNLVWTECMWEMLPLTTLAKVRAANADFRNTMLQLQEKWIQLKGEVERPLMPMLRHGLQLPGFQRPVVPRLRWDLDGSRRLERQYMRRLQSCPLEGAEVSRWKARNPDHLEAIDVLLKHVARCGHRDIVDGDAVGAYRVRETILLLRAGPARAYLAFVETTDIEDENSGTEEAYSDLDDAQGGAMQQGIALRGWLHTVEESLSLYLPFGVRQNMLVPLAAQKMTAKNAAAWFLDAWKDPWNTSILKEVLATFPGEIQTCIQNDLVHCQACPVDCKPEWYMRWWLSESNLDHAMLPQESKHVLLLWAYTWPKSSLKEAVSRCGFVTQKPYHEVCSVARWNANAWDSTVSLLPWHECPSTMLGTYVLERRNVFSAFVVDNHGACWSCGRFVVYIGSSELCRFFNCGDECSVYRVVRNVFQQRSASDAIGGSSQKKSNVTGAAKSMPQVGDRVMTLQEPWLQKILSKEKTIELRSQSTKTGWVWFGKKNVIHGRLKIAKIEALTPMRFVELQDRHCVAGDQLPYHKTRTYGLWLQHVQTLNKPVQFLRLGGSCGWARVRYTVTDLPRAPKTKAKTECMDKSVDAAVLNPNVWCSGWANAEDACLFQETSCFKPAAGILQWSEGMTRPEPLRPAIGKTFLSANTVGDGACGIHAAFGKNNSKAQLECHAARRIALDALETALRGKEVRSHHVEAVRVSLWDELALQGADGADSMEAKIFWEQLRQLHPTVADNVRQAMSTVRQRGKQLAVQKGKFLQVCRYFFLQKTEGVIDAVCSGIGYAQEEGGEFCFEERQGQRFVKGTKDIAWKPAWPQTKLEAIQNADAAFDPLRMAVFLNRDLGECIAVINDILAATKNVECEVLREGLNEYMEYQQKQMAETHPAPPHGFEAAAVDAYLMAVMDSRYFFSYDEIATVAEVRLQSLVVVTETGSGNFLPCAVVDGPADPIVIVVKNAATERRVRSHFERLAPQAVVSSFQPGLVAACEGVAPASTKEDSQTQQEKMEEAPRGEPRKQRLQNEDDKPFRRPRTESSYGAFNRDTWVESGSQDGEAEFHQAVDSLLKCFESKENVLQVLEALPCFSQEILDVEFSEIHDRLVAAVPQHVKSNITGADAVNLSMPIWRACFFPVAVLFEAWARTTGMPTIFYIDAFYTLLGSILHKSVTYQVTNFACRARYWAVGTAAPGSGKSPALEPLKRALKEVLQESPDLAPGKNTDGFHIQPIGTHIAAIERLRHTEGYQYFGASEGGPILCPAWPTSSTWNQGTHVNWQRYLDAATGMVIGRTVHVKTTCLPCVLVREFFLSAGRLA